MKQMVIGIDHGYGHIKTANFNFISGVTESNHEFPFTENVLKWKNSWYSIGENRLPYKKDKTVDTDYYVLTLAAAAQEMKLQGVNKALVTLVVGTPLTRYGLEKQALKDYLMQHKEIAFTWEGEPYHMSLLDVYVYAQGLSALTYWTSTSKCILEDLLLLADLGSGTFDVALLNNKKIISDKSHTMSGCGVSSAYNSIAEAVSRATGNSIDEAFVEKIILGKSVRVKADIRNIIDAELRKYAARVYNQLKDWGYNLDTLPVYWIGGGALIMEKYGDLDKDMNIFVLNPNANACGYELTYKMMQAKAKAAEKAAKETKKK